MNLLGSAQAAWTLQTIVLHKLLLAYDGFSPHCRVALCDVSRLGLNIVLNVYKTVIKITGSTVNILFIF